MPTSSNLFAIHVERDIVNRFDSQYPGIKRIFVERALKLAMIKPEVFESIFFNPLFVEVK